MRCTRRPSGLYLKSRRKRRIVRLAMWNRDYIDRQAMLRRVEAAKAVTNPQKDTIGSGDAHRITAAVHAREERASVAMLRNRPRRRGPKLKSNFGPTFVFPRDGTAH